MERFIRYFLAGLMILSLFLGGLFMIVPTYMDQLTALGFTPEEMRIWVYRVCLLYTSPSPRDVEESRMPSSA